MPQFAVSLPEDLGAFVERTVQSGAYTGASELISQALYSYRHQFELERIKCDRLRQELQIGVDQLDRGEGVVDFDIETFLAEMKREKLAGTAAIQCLPGLSVHLRALLT